MGLEMVEGVYKRETEGKGREDKNVTGKNDSEEGEDEVHAGFEVMKDVEEKWKREREDKTGDGGDEKGEDGGQN